MVLETRASFTTGVSFLVLALDLDLVVLHRWRMTEEGKCCGTVSNTKPMQSKLPPLEAGDLRASESELKKKQPPFRATSATMKNVGGRGEIARYAGGGDSDRIQFRRVPVSWIMVDLNIVK